MTVVATTTKDFQKCLRSLDCASMREISDSLSDMVASAKDDGEPYKLHATHGMADLLWYWAESYDPAS